MSAPASPPAVRSLRISRSPLGIPRHSVAVRCIKIVSVSPTILTKLQKECATPFPVLRHVADAMTADMRAGLAADGGSDLPMILSFVDNLPTRYISNFLLFTPFSVSKFFFFVRWHSDWATKKKRDFGLVWFACSWLYNYLFSNLFFFLNFPLVLMKLRVCF